MVLSTQALSRVPTLCGPMDWSLPDSSACEISLARMLEWVPFPSPGDLPDPGMESTISYISHLGRRILYH